MGVLTQKYVPVGYIGLGNMGRAMALNLIERGWPIVLHARRAASLESFRATTAVIVDSPAEVGRACRFLCLCVVDEVQVHEVLFDRHGAAATLTPGSSVIIHSTISPGACRGFADRLGASGISLIDAPVTGAAERGRAGTLTIVVGGARNCVEEAMPLLSDEGSHVVHLGGVGAGQIGKLLNNALFVLQTSLVDEMMALGGEMGLDPKLVLDVIASGTAASWAADFVRRMVQQGKPIFANYGTRYPGGVIEIVRKDIRLFLAELDRHGLSHRRMADMAEGAVRRLSKELSADGVL